MNGKYEDFSRRLIEIMRQKNISSSELCEKADISKQSLSQYICGSRLPHAQAVINLADALGVSIDYLLTGIEKGNIINSEGLTKEQIDYLTSSAETFKKYNKITWEQAVVIQHIINNEIYKHEQDYKIMPSFSFDDWSKLIKRISKDFDSSQN